MDEMEYPGIRISLEALMGRMVTPIQFDISTSDVITPRAIEYKYDLMLEKRSITLWAYNLETVFAEEFQTIIIRDVSNTRMRDFYDLYTLLRTYNSRIKYSVLKDAYLATSKKRKSKRLIGRESEIVARIK